MEHLRLLLPMVMSVGRVRAEASGPGEWQEDSGLGLYRAPEEGVSMDAGAAASPQSVDVEKKVSPNRSNARCSPLLSYYEDLNAFVFVGLSRQVNALQNIVCVLNREVERSTVTLEAFSHQHRLDQEKIEELSNKVRQLERTLNMRDLQLSETEHLLRELQFCTYDGIFVWKVSDFARRRQDAVGGRTPAMFSPGKTKDNKFKALLHMLHILRSRVHVVCMMLTLGMWIGGLPLKYTLVFLKGVCVSLLVSYDRVRVRGVF